jgi:hypothetical protein
MKCYLALRLILDEVADSRGVAHIEALRDPAVLRCGLLSEQTRDFNFPSSAFGGRQSRRLVFL